MASNPSPLLTPEQYLELERAATEKHEFVDGAMVAMAGGSPTHALIPLNCVFALMQALGDRCLVFDSDLRVSVHWDRLIAYPDATVLCGKPEYTDGKRDTLTNPTMVIEVLSPSTADYDRGKKALLYRGVPSMREILLIDQEPVDIEHYRRLEDGSWKIVRYRGVDDVIPLASLGCELAAAAIYRNLDRL